MQKKKTTLSLWAIWKHPGIGHILLTPTLKLKGLISQGLYLKILTPEDALSSSCRADADISEAAHL